MTYVYSLYCAWNVTYISICHNSCHISYISICHISFHISCAIYRNRPYIAHEIWHETWHMVIHGPAPWDLTGSYLQEQVQAASANAPGRVAAAKADYMVRGEWKSHHIRILGMCVIICIIHIYLQVYIRICAVPSCCCQSRLYGVGQNEVSPIFNFGMCVII